MTPRFAFATKPDKAIGDPALWERAEQLIREAFAAADISYDLKPKDGTFYAPKIDIYIDDALGPRVADGDHPGRPRRCCPSGST